MKIKAHCPFLGHTGYNAHARGFFTALSDLVDLRVDNYTWCHDRHNYLTERQKEIISEITLKLGDGTEGQFPPDWKEKIEDFKYDVDIVLHEHGHRQFWRDYQKPKIAYTMWETDHMNDTFFKRLLEYKELWVPSLWQKELVTQQGYPSDRVKVVPSGVEPDCIPRSNIISPDDAVFTFCLVGAWDHRKSTDEILQCFVELFGNDPNVQLVVSIDSPFDDAPSTGERLKKMGWGDINNINVKSFPDRKQYIEILQTSHAFLSCSRGEGWNIPLIEAMACGTPSVYSDCSGQIEFAEGKGIPIRILGKEAAHAGHPGHYVSPDFRHLKNKMQHCIDNYRSLKQAALLESHDIRKKFSWDNAARIAKSHLDNFCGPDIPLATRIATAEKLKATSKQTKKVPPVKVLFPFIAYNGTCHTEFALSAMGLLLQIYRYENTDIVISPITFESLISRARNASAAWALSSNYSHLLFIDADIGFDPHDVFKLIEADKDVVVGLYPKKYYNRAKMEALAKDFPAVFNDKEDWRALATDFSTELNATTLEKAKQGEVFEVDYAATGFMLIKTDVFRKIIEKRPDLKYTNDVDGYMSADKDYFYDFFQVGVNPSSKKYESEDYGFCQLWRSVGGKIHVIPDIKLVHTGRNHYPGDIVKQTRAFGAK